MTVYNRLVRLRAPVDYKLKWQSKTNKVDAIWYDYDKKTNEFIAQLLSTTQHPVLNNCGTLEDVDKELQSMPVCQDAVRPQKNTPERLKSIETFIDHPGFDDRDYLRSRFRNVKSKWLNHQELIQYNIELRKLGFTRGLSDWKEKYVNPRNPNQIFYRFLVGEIESG